MSDKLQFVAAAMEERSLSDTINSPDGAFDVTNDKLKLSGHHKLKLIGHDANLTRVGLFDLLLRSSANPAALPKQQQHSYGNRDHDHPDCVVAVTRMQFRHKIEVHAVDAGDES